MASDGDVGSVSHGGAVARTECRVFQVPRLICPSGELESGRLRYRWLSPSHD